MTQGSPSLPASHTPSSLDPLKLYIVLTGDVGEFICFYHASQFLHRVNYNLPRRFIALQGKKKKSGWVGCVSIFKEV